MRDESSIAWRNLESQQVTLVQLKRLFSTPASIRNDARKTMRTRAKGPGVSFYQVNERDLR